MTSYAIQALRGIILFAVGFFSGGYWLRLCQRAQFNEIGLSGHVSDLDRAFATNNKYEPLSKFEKWLLVPSIKEEKKYRQKVWRETCRDMLGEDF